MVGHRSPKTHPRRVGGIAGRAEGRFEALDSLRGIAAVMVVLFHAPIASTIRDLAVVRSGEMLVDFFFVLSGFVICHAYGSRAFDRRGVAEFLALRLGRIYPLHVAMLAAFLAFEAAKAVAPGLANPSDPAFSGANDLSTLLPNILLLHSVSIDGVLSWNTPSWSISAEFLAYLCFAAALWSGRSLAAILGLFALAAPAVLAWVSDEGMESTAHLGALRAIYGFSVGALAYRLAGAGILRRRALPIRDRMAALGRWTAIECLTAIAVIFAMVATRQTSLAYAMPWMFALAVLVFSMEAGLVSVMLRWRPLLALGAISYALYMTHMFVQLRFINLARLVDTHLGSDLVATVGRNAREGGGIDTGAPLVGDLLVLAMLAACILAALAAHHMIEQPGRRLARRWVQRWSARATRAPKRERPLEAAAAKV